MKKLIAQKGWSVWPTDAASIQVLNFVSLAFNNIVISQRVSGHIVHTPVTNPKWWYILVTYYYLIILQE
jgi:hypothetical protein